MWDTTVYVEHRALAMMQSARETRQNQDLLQRNLMRRIGVRP